MTFAAGTSFQEKLEIAGHACVNNACRTICQDSSDCGAGTSCDNGFCVPDATQCETAAECVGTQYCEAGRCLEPCSGSGTCTETSTMCSADGLCRPDWQPKPICMDDKDCAMGHVCRDNVCRTPCPTGTNDECRSFDAQLPVCGSDNLCYSVNEASPERFRQAECPTGESCIDAICR